MTRLALRVVVVVVHWANVKWNGGGLVLGWSGVIW